MQAESCPHATFLRREEEATAECSLPTDPAELPTRVRCASARCAGLLVSLLEDCVASIEHLDDAPRAYYTALEHSALLANCIELDQATAQAARPFLVAAGRHPSRLPVYVYASARGRRTDGTAGVEQGAATFAEFEVEWPALLPRQPLVVCRVVLAGGAAAVTDHSC